LFPKAAIVFLVLFLFVLPTTPAEMRTWKSTSGKFEVEAELVRVEKDGTVVLKGKSGKEIRVPLTRLRQSDQQYVRTKNLDVKKPDNSDIKKPDSSAAEGPPKTIEQLDQEAQQCRTAKDAVLVYKFHLANPRLSAEARAAAETALESWKKRADEDQVRMGKNWMPHSEADAIRKKVDEKIEHAIELLRLQNGDLARNELQEASRLDPESIKADFLMGMVYGLIAGNDQKAAYHFQRCLQREPNNVSALNNLAVSCAFQRKYADAARHWKNAAVTAPKMQALAQNIGSFLSLAGNRQVKIPPKLLSELSDAYKELTTTQGLGRPSTVAFVYTPPYGADWNVNGGKDTKGKSEAVIISSGSGFVVHPHYILTNRHVVENASGLLIVDPKNPKGEPLAAELVATSNDTDLALVRCDGLDAPAVPLSEALPPRGSDIMVLGYPLGISFGTNVKSTKGAMVAMPDASMENMCLYDAVTNPGNSGGPLCDQTGRVVAVVRAVTGSIGGSYGAAIPVSTAMPFLKQHIAELKTDETTASKLEWSAVDGRVAPSTVLILKKENLSDVGVGSGERAAR
jgi:S1-C subfamily serine protease